MAYLLQSSTGIADTNRFLYSGWFHLNSADIVNLGGAETGVQSGLLQWGPAYADLDWTQPTVKIPAPSGIWVTKRTDVNQSVLAFRGIGVVNSITGYSNPTTHSANTGTPILGLDYFIRTAVNDYPGGTLVNYVLDNWNHLAIGVRIKNCTATYDDSGPYPIVTSVSSYCDFKVMLNGVNISPNHNQSAVFDNHAENDVFSYATGRAFAHGWADPGGSPPIFAWEPLIVSPTATLPQFNMAVNGFDIGFPSKQTANAYPNNGSADQTLSNNARNRYADVQAWFGTYADPTDPVVFSKFISIVGGLGLPVDPNAAAAYFGTHSILFKGKSSDSSFFFNRGNGGSFSKFGTTSDFTPTPSYA